MKSNHNLLRFFYLLFDLHSCGKLLSLFLLNLYLKKFHISIQFVLCKGIYIIIYKHSSLKCNMQIQYISIVFICIFNLYIYLFYIYLSLRFDHRNDFNKVTNKTQNDLFVRRDIVEKYNVVQLF